MEALQEPGFALSVEVGGLITEVLLRFVRSLFFVPKIGLRTIF